MRRFPKSWILSTSLALVVLSLFPALADSQSAEVAHPGFGKRAFPVPPLPKAGPTPRTKNGHPDLSGIYFPGSTGTYDLTAEGDPLQAKFDPKVTPQEQPSLQRWALEKIKKMGPLGDAGPCLTCEPLGAAGIFYKGDYPVELVQTDKKLIILSELDTTYRIIWIDGRAHKKDPDPQFNGDAVGHWEGDTLVVDVIGLDVHTWYGGGAFRGWFPSDVAHMIERFDRPNANYFTYQLTVDDPKVLTKPWKSAPDRFTMALEPMVEYYCTNNQDYEQQNPTGPKYISTSGLDERYFDEQEYEQMKQQFPETATGK